MDDKKKIPSKLYAFCNGPLATKFIKVSRLNGDNAIQSCVVYLYINGDEEVREIFKIDNKEGQLKKLNDFIYNLFNGNSDCDTIKVAFRDADNADFTGQPPIEAYLGGTTYGNLIIDTGKSQQLNGLEDGEEEKKVALYGTGGADKGRYLARIHDLEKQLLQSENGIQIAIRDTRDDMEAIIQKKDKQIDLKTRENEQLERELKAEKDKRARLKNKLKQVTAKYEADGLAVKKGITDALHPSILGSISTMIGESIGNQKFINVGQTLLGSTITPQNSQVSPEVIYENPYSEKTQIVADWFESLEEMTGNYQEKILWILNPCINGGQNVDIDLLIHLIKADVANKKQQPVVQNVES